MKMKRWLALLLAAGMLFALSACGDKPGSSDEDLSSSIEETDPEYPVEVGGAKITAAPKKVVSLSPALTELCFDMGYGESITGVSDYCDYPRQAQSLPQTGTAQLPDFDTIERLTPDVVLSHTDFSEENLIAFQQAGIEVVVLPRAKNSEGLKTLYTDIARLFAGELTGKESGVAFYNEQMGRTESVLAKVNAHLAGANKKTAVYLRMLDFTVATGDTFESEMLEKIGFTNVAKAYGGWEYPETFLPQYDPNVIFCDESITIPMLEQNANYKKLNAVLYDIVYGYNFTAFERQGLRMFDILEDMAKKAYPEAFATE